MSTLSRRLTVLGAAAVGAGILAPVAWGQQQAVAVTKYLQRYSQKDWVLTAQLNIRAWQDIDPQTNMPIIDVFKWDTAAVVFPVIDETASSRLATGEADVKKNFVLSVNDQAIAVEPEIMGGYPCGTRLAVWKIEDNLARELGLNVKFTTSCWKMKYDEKAAAEKGWPSAWPEPAASSFKPQMFIDVGNDGQPYDMKPVKDLVAKWMSGKDPKSVPPAVLAKTMTHMVWGYCQINGKGLATSRTGMIAGIGVQGAPATAAQAMGTEFDLVCLLTAVFREVGLPARTVIGYDVGELKGDQFLGDRTSKGLRAWVEFALPDDAGTGIAWVPVDIVQLRKSSSRARPLNQIWKFFGENEELYRVIPFAFQFHPPTTVRAYQAPGFWGWMVTPKPPDQAEQTLLFSATTPSKSPEDVRKQKEADKKKKGPYGK